MLIGETWRSRKRIALVAARLAAVVAVLVAVVVVAQTEKSRKAAVSALLDRRIDEVSTAVAAQSDRYVDTLNTVAAAIGAVPDLTTSGFAQIAQPVTTMALPGATSLAFLVAADDSTVAAEQQKWRSRGAVDLLLKPAAGAREHIFSIFRQSLDGTAARSTGNDVVGEPALHAALQQARTSKQVTISDPFVLPRDQQLEPHQQQQTLVLAVPIFSGQEAAAKPELRGWAVMGLRSGDFLGETLDKSSGNGVDVTLWTTRGQGRWTRVGASRPTIVGPPDLSRRVEIHMAGRQWSLDVSASMRALAPGCTRRCRAAG